MTRVRNSLQRLLGGKHHVETRDMMLRDAGHGYDAFGANRDWVGIGLELTDFLHDRYFRVTASGQENLPSSGAAIVVANHSGTLAFDAMMLWANILRATHPARLPRAIADYFVPKLPFASTLFARVGVVGGSRDNARSLLTAHFVPENSVSVAFLEGLDALNRETVAPELPDISSSQEVVRAYIDKRYKTQGQAPEAVGGDLDEQEDAL